MFVPLFPQTVRTVLETEVDVPIATAPANVDVPVVEVATIVGVVRYCHAAIPRASMSPANVVVPVPVYVVFPDTVRFPNEAFVEYRFVEDAVVEKKFVVVAAEPVAFTNVKF